MKRVLFVCAMVLFGLNLTACTKLPLLETAEINATGGEEDNGSENPDGN